MNMLLRQALDEQTAIMALTTEVLGQAIPDMDPLDALRLLSPDEIKHRLHEFETQSLCLN